MIDQGRSGVERGERVSLLMHGGRSGVEGRRCRCKREIRSWKRWGGVVDRGCWSRWGIHVRQYRCWWQWRWASFEVMVLKNPSTWFVEGKSWEVRFWLKRRGLESSRCNTGWLATHWNGKGGSGPSNNEHYIRQQMIILRIPPYRCLSQLCPKWGIELYEWWQHSLMQIRCDEVEWWEQFVRECGTSVRATVTVIGRFGGDSPLRSMTVPMAPLMSPEVWSEHDARIAHKTDDRHQTTSILFRSIWSSLDGSYLVATSMESWNIVLHNGFNCWVKIKGNGKKYDVSAGVCFISFPSHWWWV